jgi:hypothetical protein
VSILAIWYFITSVLLGTALFFPIRKFITRMSINRFQRKNNRVMSKEELEKVQKRVLYYAGILSMTFAFVFNRFIMYKTFGGTN